MTHFLPFIILFIGGSVLTVGDIVMKKWVVDNNSFLFIIGLAIYLVGLVFLAFSFKYKNIAVASVLLVIFNVLSLLFVSWFYFREKISLLQLAGIALALIAVVILEIE